MSLIYLFQRYYDPTYSETEIVLIQAARTLPRGERHRAYQQIADICGRTDAAIKAKVARLRTRNVEPIEEVTLARRAMMRGELIAP